MKDFLRTATPLTIFRKIKERGWSTHTTMLVHRPAGRPIDEAKRKTCPGTFRRVTEENIGDCAGFENASRYVPLYRSMLKRGERLYYGYLDERCVFRCALKQEGTVFYSGQKILSLGVRKDVCIFGALRT